ERRGGEPPMVLEVEEGVAALMLAEPVGRSVEVVGALPDGTEVGFLGVIAESGQLKVLEHPLAECRSRGQVPSQSLPCGFWDRDESAHHLRPRPRRGCGRRLTS